MSAFTERCWRYVGTDAKDPTELDKLFKELEHLRGEASRWPDERQKVVGELEREESVSNRLRLLLKQSQERERDLKDAATDSDTLRAELLRYKTREELHVKPLFDAVTGYLAFAGTPEAESPESLQKRVDRAVAYKVLGSGEAVDTAKELERARSENDHLKRALDQAQDVINVVDKPRLAELDRVKKANKALTEALRLWEDSIKSPPDP